MNLNFILYLNHQLKSWYIILSLNSRLYNSINTHNYNKCLLITTLIMKFHIYVKEKKSRKKLSYIKLSCALHKLPISIWRWVLVDGKSHLSWIESYGLKSSYIWERALLQIPYYIDCDIVPTTSNLILLGWKIMI